MAAKSRQRLHRPFPGSLPHGKTQSGEAQPPGADDSSTDGCRQVPYIAPAPPCVDEGDVAARWPADGFSDEKLPNWHQRALGHIIPRYLSNPPRKLTLQIPSAPRRPRLSVCISRLPSCVYAIRTTPPYLTKLAPGPGRLSDPKIPDLARHSDLA